MHREPLRWRLSAMMFGQYFILGAWAVTLATFLMAPPSGGGLAFPPSYTGWVYSTFAIAGILSSLLTGFLADRLFSAQKMMAVFHLAGGAVVGGVGFWCAYRRPLIEQAYRDSASRLDAAGVLRAIDDTFPVLFGLMLMFSFFTLATLTLSNAVGMRNLRNPQRNFGSVRLWGTVGWVAAGICVQALFGAVSPGPLFLASASSIAFGLYCFTLPNTPPKAERGGLREALGLPALKLLENTHFIVLIACALVVAVIQPFYAVYTNRFLGEVGVSQPTAVQTLAQVGEIATLMLFPVLLPRWGFKGMLVLGLVALVARNGSFASESIPIVVALGLPLSGVGYACFTVVAAMYVDRIAPAHLRASAQAIVVFISQGLGTLAGTWLAGIVVEQHANGEAVAWGPVWLVPTAIAAVITVAFVGLFRAEAHPHRVSK